MKLLFISTLCMRAVEAESSAHLRRMDGPLQVLSVPAGCGEACSGMQCMYEDFSILSQQAERISTTGDLEQISAVAKNTVAATCHHQRTVACAYSAPACAASLNATMASLQVSNFLASTECMCTACPDYGQMTGAFFTFAGASTVTSLAGESQLMAALCPMTATLHCMIAAESCQAFFSTDMGTTLPPMATMQDDCTRAGFATSFSTAETYTSTCSSQSTGGSEASGSEASGTVGLLRLNILAGWCWLFSILK